MGTLGRRRSEEQMENLANGFVGGGGGGQLFRRSGGCRPVVVFAHVRIYNI